MTLQRCNFATRFHHPEVQLCHAHPYHDTAEVQLCDTHPSSEHHGSATLRLASIIVTPPRCNYVTHAHHHDSTEVQLCDQHQSSRHQGGATLRHASTIMTTRRCNFATRINSYDTTGHAASGHTHDHDRVEVHLCDTQPSSRCATLRCASINMTPRGATFCNAHPSS